MRTDAGVEERQDFPVYKVDPTKDEAAQIAQAEQIFEREGYVVKAEEVVQAEDSEVAAEDAIDGQALEDGQEAVLEDEQVPEEQAPDAEQLSALEGEMEGDRYWFVVPDGSSISFVLDYTTQEDGQQAPTAPRVLRLYGASASSYAEALKALDVIRVEDSLKEEQERVALRLEWTASETTDDSATAGDDDVTADDEPSDDVATADKEAASQAGLTEQTITAKLYADKTKRKPSTEQGVVITLEGMLPQKATAAAYPIKAEIDEQTVLAAYDITVYNADGSVFQPAEGSPIKVTISSSALQTGDGAVEVYHAEGSEKVNAEAAATEGDDATASDDLSAAADEGEQAAGKETKKAESADEDLSDASATFEHVGTAERTDAATVSFYATHFSPYALAGPVRAPGDPGTLNTEDTRAVGITLNLFDYTAYDGSFASNGNSHLSDSGGFGSPNYNTGINSLNGQFRDLRFYPSGISPNSGEPWTINNYTGGQHGVQIALQGVVRSTLDPNGYPHTTGFNGQSSNLSYLFDPNESADGKKSYADVNHLFTLDAAGYYRYDSGWGKADSSGNMRNGNYAYYNPNQGNGGDFVVYNRTFTNSNGGDQGVSDATSDSVGFFPFDPYNENNRNVKLDNHTPHHNHHLGLSMSASFMIPEGRTVNGNDMIFNFSGDDDMWVFIDDVLVLDIGGIHQPVSGSINFTAGNGAGLATINQGVQSVSGQSTIGQSKSIADIFAAAGKTWDGLEYSQHTIKCFYLERGGCYSDLSLSFNLPIYNPGQIHVTKTVDGPGSANYMETGFKFKVFIETSQGSGQYYQYLGPVTMDNGTPISGADADGTYTLKSGEGFKVPTQNDKLRYYVQEIDPGGAFSTTINGQATGVTDGVVQSPTEPIGEQPELNYRNSVAGVTVSVQKEWYEQDGSVQTEGLPESVSLTLHRTWTTEEGGGTTPTPTKHRVTFRVTSYAQTNAFISSVDDVADGGSLTFYPYGGVTSTGQGDPWSLPVVSKQSGSASLGGSNPSHQWVNWKNVPGYTLSNITSDVTILLTYNQWITVDPTRTDRAVPNVTSYTQAQSGGGTPTPGTVVHHDVIVNAPDDPSPVSGLVNPITVTADTDWRGEWNGLPIADAQGNPYTYYVDESLVPAGYVVVYENNGTTNGSGSHTGIPSGEVTVKNQLAYELPHTGGSGVTGIMLAGLAAVVCAGVMLVLSWGKRVKGSRGL